MAIDNSANCKDSFSLALEKELIYAEYVSRTNRFIARCRYEDREIEAFLPNPGRLWELLFSGRMLILKAHNKSMSERKTAFTVTGVIHKGHPVMLDTHENNRVARWLIETGRVPGFEKFRVKKNEVVYGNSRFDFLLEDEIGNYYLEVKSCTLFRDGIAMFPDAPSERASRHVNELISLSRNGTRCGILFIVHSDEPRYFLPEFHTDPFFADNLKNAEPYLDIVPVSVRWQQDLSIKDDGRILEIPWEILDEENTNRGSYIVILELEEDTIISVGELGKMFFRRGFYIYVGSGMGNLEKRMSRHRRKRKNRHWHIDYIREHAKVVNILPIRSSRRLECEIASDVRKISDSSIKSFGSSDCRCESHLFYSSESPLKCSGFIDVLLYYRIGRLGSMLNAF